MGAKIIRELASACSFRSSLSDRITFALHTGRHRLAKVCIALLLLSCCLPTVLPARATLRCSTANRTGGSTFSGIIAGDRGSSRAGRRATCPATCARSRRSRRSAWRYACLLGGPALARALVLALLLRRLSLCGIKVRLLSGSASGGRNK